MEASYPDYPFQGRYVDLGGLRMHCLDEGPREGEPLVMLHGNPTWSYFYRKLVLALRDKYRVVAPDHIGMGLSEKPDDRRYDYTLARRVRDLEGLLDELGIKERITLVVHDWGGMIGLAYATGHLDRVRRLVLFNTAAFHLPAGKRFPWQLGVVRTPWLGDVLVRGLNEFCRFAARTCVVRGRMRAGVRAAYLAPYDSWKHRLAVLRFVQDIPLRPGDRAYDLVSEVEARLPSFETTPKLICWGMKDLIFDPAFLDRWVEFWPSAEAHRFEDAGHYVLEDAGEEIAPIVRSFLDSHPIHDERPKQGEP